MRVVWEGPLRCSCRHARALAREPSRRGDRAVRGLRERRPAEGRADYRSRATLLFERPLAREGRLGFWRWLSILLGVAGTYRQNDSVDVVYQAGGRRIVASGLPFETPEPGEQRG